MTQAMIEGFVPVTVTPFDRSGAVDHERFAALLQWYLGRGAGALCVGADNGESWALDTEALGQVVATAVRVAGDRVPVLAGAMGPASVTTSGAVSRARAAAEAGASAVLLSPPPYMMRATDDEIVARYAAVYQAAKLPLFAYNAPGHFGVNLGPDLLQSINDTCDLIGLKESSRAFDHSTRIIRRFGDRISVMMGPGWFIMPGIALGARGFLSTGPDLLGEDSARICELARGTPCEASRDLHERVSRLYHSLLDLGLGTPPAPIKAALRMLGQDMGVPADPVAPLSAEATGRLRDILIELGFEIRG
ncbi:MAG: dihydrodipicolinate synthase family protein [Roseovarius sp.]|uniref:dihydrodipicolinate synthase family protein n=1 Tax=Roseovarius sp. TaxID=1486281 RepID=UPI0032EB1F34